MSTQGHNDSFAKRQIVCHFVLAFGMLSSGVLAFVLAPADGGWDAFGIVALGVSSLCLGVSLARTGAALLRKRRAELRAREGRCPPCGYDLTGNVSGRCPECGAATDAAGQHADASPPQADRHGTQP